MQQMNLANEFGFVSLCKGSNEFQTKWAGRSAGTALGCSERLSKIIHDIFKINKKMKAMTAGYKIGGECELHMRFTSHRALKAESSKLLPVQLAKSFTPASR